ncbi:hypothetical protein CGMCC3_g3328 [Colletotrichum fructicola]|uniref:Uncharacterized protein n=1 Tax=Colletotrichum fructicola (strain Nara gc5) TaxID=1213859 RepID=A0A7J6IPP3_COLFN|nr:uncharacterized protein CGMCC3_g3328 [Colletotrichum fructicola]KAE9580753.1 hypothetical protein CGMCC3_g3328 [Colletotrichum fructicola]KAF4478895.1 hypothetical protein CGGC5_v012656 [Colletotrichum fructicola Nara gc5]KAF5490482.1 hypothetical protein CGCF413_v011587 [Colletotrichum fructicola]
MEFYNANAKAMGDLGPEYFDQPVLRVVQSRKQASNWSGPGIRSALVEIGKSNHEFFQPAWSKSGDPF